MTEEKELRLEDQDLRLLKVLTTDPLLASEFANTYDESLFVGDARPFAKSVISYIKAYKNVPTKRVMLEHCQTIEAQANIGEIWDAVEKTQATSSEFKYDLDKVKNRYSVEKLDGLNSLLSSPLEFKEKMKQAQKELELIQKVQSGQRQAYVQQSLANYMPEFKQEYNIKRKDKTFDRGIMTGYSFLDYVTNGLRPAELLIIGAESGSGKSMMLNNMAIQMWLQKNTIFTDPADFTLGYNVLYFSLEMPFKACARRSLSRIADIPMYELRDANLNKVQMEQLVRATKFIETYPNQFEIVDIPRGTTVEHIEARFQDACLRYQPHIVVVDYLGLLEDHNAEGDDWLKLGYIAGRLHEFARVYNITVLTAVQLNRVTKTAKDSSELVGLHRIGRSSLIAHSANCFIQIETRKDEKNYADLKYHIIKNLSLIHI